MITDALCSYFLASLLLFTGSTLLSIYASTLNQSAQLSTMAPDTILTALLRRLYLEKPKAGKRCPSLEAPTELRTIIYTKLAPRGYLLAVPYKDYMGLFLSCKQIQQEMTDVTLRPTTNHVSKLNSTP